MMAADKVRELCRDNPVYMIALLRPDGKYDTIQMYDGNGVTGRILGLSAELLDGYTEITLHYDGEQSQETD